MRQSLSCIQGTNSAHLRQEIAADIVEGYKAINIAIYSYIIILAIAIYIYI